MQNPTLDALWQDSSVKFDVGSKFIRFRSGEFLVDKLHPVEDTKGNLGDKGTLWITNLRLIWISGNTRRINLSIGYACILNINTKTMQNDHRRQSDALHIMTKFSGIRYEFIFTHLALNSSIQLFSAFIAVYKAYDTSRMYREMKLRACLLDNKKLMLLPKEKLYEEIDGAWNLSSDQGNLGRLFVTNIRVVWNSTMNVNFNISIPYLHVVSCVYKTVATISFRLQLLSEIRSLEGHWLLKHQNSLTASFNLLIPKNDEQPSIDENEDVTIDNSGDHKDVLAVSYLNQIDNSF
ncbi:Bardet-Biedl syndrome 5 protein [Paragonimus westermani]|uniref:Bardet-Biedl syndrome 5 protein n=1 Tax=Paragonimus westermani TaxID=34504 RepID=A0A5J4NBC0_9TREM|nr:Bardet-Biedl syndrome 5 protein [Paragonimus westermani]